MLFSVIENQLGSLEKRAGRCASAIPHFEAGYRILMENHAGGDELAHTDVDLAQCLLDTGNSFDAKARAEDALDQLSRAGLGDADRAVPWSLLAQVAMQRGDRTKAISFARRVIAASEDTDRDSVGEARERMQKLLAELHAPPR
jgi:tetratricopeptide (TPR) repeat protein